MPYPVRFCEQLPEDLARIPDAPRGLYYKGDWEGVLSGAHAQNCLAVVGSRQMTSYGRRVVEKLVGDCASAGVTIVSGFMYGVDAAAHEAAVLRGGKTIAVMPCGIERIHPAYQEKLYDAILQSGGLVVSEYEGDEQPQNWMYPRRNRIVAGLSQATLVVEAALKSGSLITAKLASLYERTLFAVPGPITSSVSLGTAELIKNGAVPVTCADDILSHYKGAKPLPIFRGGKTPQGGAPHDTLEKSIMEHLRREPHDIDMLARALKKPVSVVGTALSLMHLSGIVSQEGNVYYIE